MRWFLPYIAGIMVYAMTPGMSEIVEDVFHLLAEGQAAHESADADHEPQGEEQGCSGTFHICQCHSSVTFLTGTAPPEIAAASEHRQNARWGVDDLRAEGCRADMFRPPAA